MKSWVVLGLVTVLGIVTGVGMTLYESIAEDELFHLSDKPATSEVSPKEAANVGAVPQKLPKVQVVGSAEYDFGSMELNAKKSHVFQVKNVGEAPLELELGRVTCKCTVSDISGMNFKPGEIAKVKLEWSGKTITSDPDFYQTAEILTNDPDQKVVSLKIRGYVTENIRALPNSLAVGRVSSNDGTATKFRLFGFRSDEVKIEEMEFENAELAQYFDLDFSPLPEEELKQEKGASSGLLAALTLKPGLPLGPITQTIRIVADVGKKAEIHIPVNGLSVGDIVIASPKFQANKSLLTFGALKRTESANALLHMFVRGAHRHETKFEVGSIEPEGYIKVNIGPPQELNQGKAVKYAFTVEIPSGLEPINCLGSEQAKHGRIVLNTTHPQTKQIIVNVKFAVD